MLVKFLKNIASNFYPELCIMCETEAPLQERDFCLRCNIQLPFTNHFENRNNNLVRHFWGRVDVQMGAALFDFRKQNEVQSMIHKFKYRNRKDIGIQLGKMAGEKYLDSEYFGLADIIIPVPLSRSKEWKRGYNQATIFGNGISEATGIEVADNVLLKTKDTSTQTKKSRVERVENVLNSFQLKHADKLLNKHVLLVDDVITTGATLEACILAMENVPGIRISVLTIGIAKG